MHYPSRTAYLICTPSPNPHPALLSAAIPPSLPRLQARPKSLNAVVTELGHIVNALGGDPRGPDHEQVGMAKFSRVGRGG